MGMQEPWLKDYPPGMTDPEFEHYKPPTMEEVFHDAYPPPEEYHYKPTLVDKAAKIGGLIALWQFLFGKK